MFFHSVISSWSDFPDLVALSCRSLTSLVCPCSFLSSFFLFFHNNCMKQFWVLYRVMRWLSWKICASVPHGFCHKYAAGRSRCSSGRVYNLEWFSDKKNNRYFVVFFPSVLLGICLDVQQQPFSLCWGRSSPKALWESYRPAFTGPQIPGWLVWWWCSAVYTCVTTVSCR